MKRQNISSCFLLCMLTAALGLPAGAQDVGPYEGFETLSWGATIKQIQSAEKRKFVSKMGLSDEYLEQSPYGKVLDMVFAPPTVRLEYEGRYSEKVIYFLVNDKLTGVIHKPGTNLSFRPHKILKALKTTYGDTPKEDKGISYPDSWARFDKELEYPLTLDWENAKGKVRLCTKVWTPLDMRQVFATIYSSSEMNKLAEKRITELEEAKKKAEEEARRAAEAAEAASTPAPPANP